MHFGSHQGDDGIDTTLADHFLPQSLQSSKRCKRDADNDIDEEADYLCERCASIDIYRAFEDVSYNRPIRKIANLSDLPLALAESPCAVSSALCREDGQMDRWTRKPQSIDYALLTVYTSYYKPSLRAEERLVLCVARLTSQERNLTPLWLADLAARLKLASSERDWICVADQAKKRAKGLKERTVQRSMPILDDDLFLRHCLQQRTASEHPSCFPKK